MADRAYPVRVKAYLDHDLSRGLWLVKWLLVIPHYVVLAFLWIAFFVLTVVAWVAILVTGRYPRSIFEFNLGVLRWSWRVHYYAYAALGTDRYPPFTFAEVPDYPATLDIEYPGQLSRGLALVKWWLLALPHYLIVAFFVGGGTYVALNQGDAAITFAGGLVGLCAVFAAIALLFTGRYPQGLFDFILGMNRWALRVVAYAGLMTDEYPPFRFDAGGAEPRITAGGSTGSTGSTAAGPVTSAAPSEGTTDAGRAAAPPAPTPESRHTWTAGRVVAAVIGSFVIVVGFGMAVGGAALLWLDSTQRDDAGFVTSGTTQLESSSYAIRSEMFRFEGIADWRDVVGDVEVTADSGQEIFVGIAPAEDVAVYLADVEHDTLTDPDTTVPWGVGDNPSFDRHTGGAPAAPAEAQDMWVAAASGTGKVSLDWQPQSGSWAVVIMNADGSAGVAADASVGATAPALDGIGAGLIVAGIVALVFGGLIIALAVRLR